MKRCILLLVLLLAVLPARAQDAFVAALSGLGGNFNAQVEAAERLGALGDARALPALRALSDGRLLRGPEGALFIPPIRSNLVMKSAAFCEKYGRRFVPFMAGVYLVEASKQIYATADRGGGSKVHVRGRGILLPKPAQREARGH